MNPFTRSGWGRARNPFRQSAGAVPRAQNPQSGWGCYSTGVNRACCQTSWNGQDYKVCGYVAPGSKPSIGALRRQNPAPTCDPASCKWVCLPMPTPTDPHDQYCYRVPKEAQLQGAYFTQTPPPSRLGLRAAMRRRRIAL